jgi:hypothetical protein
MVRRKCSPLFCLLLGRLYMGGRWEGGSARPAVSPRVVWRGGGRHPRRGTVGMVIGSTR